METVGDKKKLKKSSKKAQKYIAIFVTMKQAKKVIMMHMF